MLEVTDHVFEIVSGLALLGLCVAIYFQRLELIRVRTMIRCERVDRKELESDFAAVLSCSQTIGERIRSQGAKQHSILKKLDIIDQSRSTGEQQPYVQVHKLVEQGLGLEEIGEICNLARGEVELLSRFAAHRTAA
jgi:hypothetical protein